MPYRGRPYLLLFLRPPILLLRIKQEAIDFLYLNPIETQNAYLSVSHSVQDRPLCETPAGAP